MNPTAPRIPWWWVAILGLVMTAVVAATRAFGFAAQVVALLIVLVGFVATIQRRSHAP